MRRFRALVVLALVAFGCNGILGLDAGRPRPDALETGGDAGAAGAGDTSGVGASGFGGNAASGGSSSTNGGDGTQGGESGTSSGGSAGMGGGGRGGTSGASSGDGGEPGGSSGAGAGGVGPCTSSLDCRENHYDFCIDGTCQDITSNECDVIIGDGWINEDGEAKPYVLGALARWYDADEKNDQRSEPFYWNLVLAMQEFSAFGRIEIEGEERRPVLLLCHGPVPAPTPAMGGLVPLEAALDHLTGLGVSSVLMLLESRLEVELLVRRSLLDPGYHDLFFLDVGGGTGWVFFLDTGLLNLDDSGRLWHMRGDTQSLALPFGPLVRRIEELVNPGASTGNAAEPTRLAMVYGTEDEFDRELFGWLADDISTPLSINTTSFVEELLQYNRILIIDKDHEDEERRSMEEQVANFGAHIVLFFTGNEALVPKLERAYADAGARPPFYVFGSEFTRRPSLLGHVDIESLLPARTRMIGLNFASADDPTLYQAYRLRISAIAPGLYENVNEWRVKPFATVYDATYYLVYAAVAGGPGGLAKAAGFRRLISGPRHEIGPGGIESVVARLSRADTTVSLSGPSGDFPFHAPTGGRIAFSNAWCIDEGPIDNDFLNNLEYVFDVLRYDNALRDFTGTITCFDP